MKNGAFLLFFLLFLASPAAAQFVSPLPVIETDVRERSSVKIRSIELERVKRETGKKNAEKPGRAAVNNFLEIKADFEKIQKLESEIVTVYQTGKEIDFVKIAALSAEITQGAARLKENLFSVQNKDPKALADESPTTKKEAVQPQPLKNLIVELDNAIAGFVSNPIFLNAKKAELKDREQAESALEQIIKFSTALKAEAEKNAVAKN